MKTELKTKSVSLLLVTIMLCSIFTGAVTADVNKSAANTSLALGNRASCIGCAGYEPWYYYAAGGIVNTANGNLYLAETDISIKARGFDIELVRSYNSHNSGKHGPFGFGWTFNYNIYLVKNEDGSVTFFDEDGSAHSFASEGGNNYTAPPGIDSKLVKNADDSFTLGFTDGSKYNFGSNGKILNITDKNDNYLNFEYNILGRLTRISDDSGLYLNLNYNLRGRISSVSDTLGREINYEYEVANLVNVTDAMRNSSSYEYYDHHKLKSKVDRVDSMLIFSYYDDGKVKDVKVSKYGKESVRPFTVHKFEYASNTAYVTDASGHKTKIEHNSNGNPIKITDPLGGVATVQWDSDMKLVSFTDANGATTSYEYDAYGNVIKETDALGNPTRDEWNNIDTEAQYISLLVRTTNARGFITSLEYDTDFNLIKISDATGNYSVMSYDSFGDMGSIRNFRGFTTFFGYDTHGYIINITDATGNVTELSYDAVGRLLSTTDANGGRTRYEYDANDNLVKETDALGNETKYEYNAEGTLINTIDAKGHSTTTAPNVLGKIGGITDASGNTTSFKYDQKGNLIEYADAKGNKTRMNYDALDRLISVADALGNRESYVYDAVGNRIHAIDKTNNLTSHNYDALNRLTKTTDPLGHTTTYSYDAVSNLISVQNANGRTTKYECDALDRLSKISDPSGSETRFSYDANGNQLSHTDAKGQVVRYEYDALDMLTKTISPLGYQTKYAYDAVGNLISRVDANGNISTYSYDPLNRLLSTSYPNGGKVRKEYDAVGNILKISNNGIGLNDVTDFSYDELDRLVSVKRDYGAFSKTIKYSYDANGNRVKMKDPAAGITRYEFDALSRLVKLTNPSGEVTTYQYDKLDRTVGTQYQNGISTHYTYDAAGRMLELVNKNSSGAIISSYAYTHDNMGNRLTKTEAKGEITRYEYDVLDQLTKVAYPPGEGFTQYTYDLVGNRLSEKNANGTTYYTYDADDRLLTAGGTGYNYDNNGNLIRKIDATGTTRYEYDYENRLTKVTLPDASQVTYQYSPLGDRLSKTDKDGTTNYLYDFENIFYEPEDILMELDAAGTQKARYTHGPGVDKPVSMTRGGATLYYLFDGLGSVTSLTDVNEDIVASYKYDVFGKILEETGAVKNPYKFTGREQDEETGLYFYRARYYDAEIGRFLSKDSLMSEMRIAGNLYNYVDNNPVNVIDPSGHGWLSGFWQTYKYYFNKFYVKPVVKAAKVVKQKVVKAAKVVKKVAKATWKATVDFAQTYWHYAKYWWPKVAKWTALAMLAAVAGWYLGPLIYAAGELIVYLGVAGIMGVFALIEMAVIAAWPYILMYAPLIAPITVGLIGWLRSPFRGNLGELITKKIPHYWEIFKDLFGDNEGENTESIEGFEREEDGETPPGPGNDHPDDNYDVSILTYSPRGAGGGGGSYESESEIAVLSRGFYRDFSDILYEFGESCAFVDVDVSIEELNKHPVFVIPSGGFYGLSSLKSFKSKLEQYVRNGSTLIVLAQQRGYEFDAVPGDLSGYGWLEDQSCHYRSVGISTYHPILSGQDSVISDVNVDGYFTKYPEDATVLLSRTKNGMPAMLMYEYGNGTGTVIATTIYTDWAYGHYQATADGKHLVRDMVVWAKNPEELPEYGSGDAMDIPINITSYIDLTADKVKFTLIDPDKNVVDTVNVTTSISPYETKTINFTDTARSKLGIWHLDYSLVNDSAGEVQCVRDTQRFAVSKYAENPDGWVYQGKKITFSVTTPEEKYLYGSDVPFTIHIWNKGDTDRNISFRTYYKDWMLRTKLSEQNVNGHLDVPAGGEASFTHTLHVGNIRLSHNQLIIYASFSEGDRNLGRTEKVVWMYHPSVGIEVETEKKEYATREDVSVLLNLTNKRSATCNATVTVRTLDPDNKKVYEDSFNINLNASSSKNKTLSFSLPLDSKYGIYLVTAEAYSNGRKIGSGSTYFKVSKSYIAELSFDKPDKVYKVRQDISVFLNITNVGAVLWSSTVNTSIPDLVFADSKLVALNPNETEEIRYDLNIGNVTVGKHDVIVTIEMDNSTINDCFFIPESNLELSIGRTSYNAGENVSINLTNIGGVDTTFNCSVKFSDSRRFVIYENSTQGNISVGENKTISFEISGQAVNGTYHLIASCKDLKTNKTTMLLKSYEISGLKAFLTTSTNKKIYFKNETIRVLTNISNLDGSIENATLNHIVYSGMYRAAPEVTTESLDDLLKINNTFIDAVVNSGSDFESPGPTTMGQTTQTRYKHPTKIESTEQRNRSSIAPMAMSDGDIGRFTVGTTGGDPENPNDDFVELMYGHPDPWSSFTTIRVDGNDYIYGSSEGNFISLPHFEGSSIVSDWEIEDVVVTQKSTIVYSSTGNPDALEIKYSIVNKNETSKGVGVRVMIDTQLAGNDGAPFVIPDVGNVTKEREFSGADVPIWWTTMDSLTDPDVIAHGTLRGVGSDPDKFAIAYWEYITDTLWDYEVNSNQWITDDSAIGIWWNPISLSAEQSREIATFYGIGYVSEVGGVVVWEEEKHLSIAEEEETDISTNITLNTTGKFSLFSTLFSYTSQVIDQNKTYFYITEENTSLTLKTDNLVYKPNEEITIFGEVTNYAVIANDYNLSIKVNGEEIFSDTFSLDPNQSHIFTTNTRQNNSFILEGTVNGITITDFIRIEYPSVNAIIIAPDIVGFADFDVGVLIENIGNIAADLAVNINSTWNITVPEGESRLLETTKNITKNTTLNVIISGDVNKTIQKEIIFGENAEINITPEPTYLEGVVAIPFTINNTGVLDSEFNATFSISPPDNQTITKHFFVPKEENISDSISFNVTKGAHLLRYSSPFETENTTINVLSPPEFIVSSIHPAELNFTIGENVTLVFMVKNVGGSEGEATLKLAMIDFEDTNRTWIIAGAEENISFNVTIPDDLEEKSYKGIYVLDGTRSEFTFFVQGANISVDASLDKSMYAEGGTAVLTLELTNECRLDLDLYSRVKFNEFDSVQNFTLSGSGTETLVFYVPANFSGDNKVLYTVYMDSGRALYINSIYIYEELPDAPLRLFTDKDVYNMGEEVTIYIVDVTGTDMLNLTAPNFSYNDTISGPTTLEFTLPALRSGTYYIEYSFGNLSSTHPFDVRGYSARILEASLDKEEYVSGNEMKLEMNIEANMDVSGLLKTWIYDPKDDLIDEFAMNKTLEEGENEIEVCRTLSTSMSGIHVIVYGFYTDLGGHSLTLLVSGAEYFDAEAGGLCGDVAPYPDCNGIVDMGDVILLLNNVSYPENPRYVLCNDWAGDCRCTGVRDMGDVILLLNYVSYPEDPRYVLDCC